MMLIIIMMMVMLMAATVAMNDADEHDRLHHVHRQFLLARCCQYHGLLCCPNCICRRVAVAPSSKPDRKPSASPGMTSMFGPMGFGFRVSPTATLNKNQGMIVPIKRLLLLLLVAVLNAIFLGLLLLSPCFVPVALQSRRGLRRKFSSCSRPSVAKSVDYAELGAQGFQEQRQSPGPNRRSNQDPGRPKKLMLSTPASNKCSCVRTGELLRSSSTAALVSGVYLPFKNANRDFARFIN